MISSPESTVPFNDLSRNTVALRPQLDAAIARVLTSGWYVMGPEHNALESELEAYLGVSNAILVGNGTDALQLALAGLGVGPNDSVLTAANAGGYTATASRSIGAIPAYADVDPLTHLVTAGTLERAFVAAAEKPKVAVVTHLFGAAAEMESIMAWARKREIAIIEDCAQSLGASVDGRRAGAHGDVSTTSFYPTKNLGALGDGGAVFTSRGDIASRIRQLRQYGWESKYRTTLSGGRNSRLDEMQAAILRVKLPFLDSWNERRRAIHSQYEAAVTESARFVNTDSESFAGHLAVIETGDRAAVREVFDSAGIKTEVHYPTPDHRQPLEQGNTVPNLPVTERISERILSLPLFPELTQDEIDRVVTAIGRI